MAEIITTRPLFAVPNAKELVEEKEPVNEYFGLFKSNDGGRCLHRDPRVTTFPGGDPRTGMNRRWQIGWTAA